MTYQKGISPFAFNANADLSAKQFYLVQLASTNGRVALCGAGEWVLGVLQDKPAAAGRACGVQTKTGTISKCYAAGASAAISIGDPIKSNASGVAVKSSTGGPSYVIGRALEAVSTGVNKYIPLLITHEGPASTA